jgi:uncharacterized membrane protein YqaE (UPF0057 family)
MGGTSTLVLLFDVRADGAISMSKPVMILLAIFVPPVAIYLHQGGINQTFWINLVLTFLGGIPGCIHALYVVLTQESTAV